MGDVGASSAGKRQGGCKERGGGRRREGRWGVGAGEECDGGALKKGGE